MRTGWALKAEGRALRVQCGARIGCCMMTPVIVTTMGRFFFVSLASLLRKASIAAVVSSLLLLLAMLLASPSALDHHNAAGRRQNHGNDNGVAFVSALSSLAPAKPDISRRAAFRQVAAGLLLESATPEAALAAPADCYADCVKNCKLIAPKDPEYCQSSCREYCDRDDRSDGLSGSVSSEGGEVGILGGAFGTGTVVKGQDKPPSVSLPGLDFTSSKGKKLIGY